MFAIFKKEFRFFFSSATGYIVLGLFLLIVGLFLWVLPGQYNILDAGYAQVDGLFQLAPWLFMFLCPAISMRFFSEEKQNHTWDWLKTQPITRSSIVLGKFFAGWLLTVVALLPTITYYFSVAYMAEPRGNVDGGIFWGAFIGLIFLAGINIAIGTFASSLTKNQVVAFILAATLCFIFFYGFDLVSNFASQGSITNLVQNCGINEHYKSISRGVVELRDIVYFLSIGTAFNLFTIYKIDK